LKTLDLEDLYPKEDRILLDIRDQLYEGLILREKDFRAFIKETDWSVYDGKLVAINCSEDVVIPHWAFMLLGIALSPYAKRIVFGDLEALDIVVFQDLLKGVDWEEYRDARVVVKGCSKVKIPVQVYVEVAVWLKPIASSIMFGEPCSTVPLFKRPKT
jgi:hypothetical protein